MTEKSMLQMRTKFQEIENCVYDRVKKIVEKINARTLSKKIEDFQYEDECVEGGEEDDMSTQFF